MMGDVINVIKEILCVIITWLSIGTMTSLGILALILGTLKNNWLLFTAGILIIGMMIEGIAYRYSFQVYEQLKKEMEDEE